jgi:hypothetical protein
MGTRCNCRGDPERELQPWALFPFTFKDASSSDGLLGSLVIPAVPKKIGLEGSPVNMRARQKPKKNPPG